MENVETPGRVPENRPPAPPIRTASLSSEAVLDALKMILLDAPLHEVLRSLALLIEAQSEGMFCSIFLLEQDGLHLRYGSCPEPAGGLPGGDGWPRRRPQFRIVRHRRVPSRGGLCHRHTF